MPCRVPHVDVCCGCVTELKTAAAIIAVLAIVTSPAVSWAVVRHSYVIRMSCFVSTSETRKDVLDINLSNVLSFGFGTNAGLGPSCLGPQNKNSTSTTQLRIEALKSSKPEDAGSSTLMLVVRLIGWIVLVADLIFLLCSIAFLITLFKGSTDRTSKLFIISAIVSIALSFIYGMLYVIVCVFVGGSFPLFEFIFTLIDLGMWAYFLIVVNSYRNAGG